MSLSTFKPLSEDELDTLDDFLYSDAVSEDSLDIVGVHGLLSACIISPKSVPESTWLDLILDSEPNWASVEQRDEILGLLRRFYATIELNLYSDQEVELPCDLTLVPEEDEEQSALTWWSQAFMEGVFINEKDWFEHQQEEQAAELLLPIMVISELFDDPEMTQMLSNEALCEEMAQQFPELLVDLYLLFHSPEK